jgi:hypothetical protein
MQHLDPPNFTTNGPLAGILRSGTRVLGHGDGVAGDNQPRNRAGYGVVVGADPDITGNWVVAPCGVWADLGDTFAADYSRSFHPDCLQVDLSDPTSQVHCAWWLAEVVPLTVDSLPLHNALGLWERPGGWEDADRSLFWDQLMVVGLDLDEMHAATLPDSNLRYVDALALATICLDYAASLAEVAAGETAAAAAKE